MKNQMTMQEQLGYGKQDPVMHGQAGRKWLGAMNAERVQGMELQNEAMQIHNDFMEYENRMRKDMMDMQRKRAQVLLSIADCAARNGGMVPVGMISPFDAALGGTGSYGGSMLTGTGRGTRLRSVRARNGQAYGYDPVAYSPADIIRLDKSYGGILSDAARNFYLQNATKGLTDKQIRDMGLVYESKADIEKAKGDAALELEKLKGGNALELEKLKGKSRLAEQEAKYSGMDSKSLADVVDKLGTLMRDPEAMKNPWTKAMLEGVFKQNNWALPKLQDEGIAGVETITQGEGDAGGEKKYTPEQIETMQKEIAERKERSELSSLMAGGDGSQELIEYTDDKGGRVQTNGYRTKSGKIYDSRGNEIKDYSKSAPKPAAESASEPAKPTEERPTEEKDPAPENAKQAKDKGTQKAASEPEKAKDSKDKFLDDTLAELEKDLSGYNEKVKKSKASADAEFRRRGRLTDGPRKGQYSDADREQRFQEHFKSLKDYYTSMRWDPGELTEDEARISFEDKEAREKKRMEDDDARNKAVQDEYMKKYAGVIHDTHNRR